MMILARIRKGRVFLQLMSGARLRIRGSGEKGMKEARKERNAIVVSTEATVASTQFLCSCGTAHARC